MEGSLLGLVLGYLVGLSVLGYILLLHVINGLEKNFNFSKLVVKFLTIGHFILGVSGMVFVPSLFIYFRMKKEGLGMFIFSITLFFVLCIVFFIAKRWGAIIEKRDGQS